MNTEKFKAAFIAHVPDADPAKHRCVIKTSLYELTSILVKDDDEAVEVCKELARKEGVHAFILCPGFTHKAIARIVDAVGDSVSVNVARGDGPSNEVAFKIMSEAGWFKQ
jgi:quinolinate synthase